MKLLDPWHSSKILQDPEFLKDHSPPQVNKRMLYANLTLYLISFNVKVHLLLTVLHIISYSMWELIKFNTCLLSLVIMTFILIIWAFDQRVILYGEIICWSLWRQKVIIWAIIRTIAFRSERFILHRFKHFGSSVQFVVLLKVLCFIAYMYMCINFLILFKFNYM